MKEIDLVSMEDLSYFTKMLAELNMKMFNETVIPSSRFEKEDWELNSLYNIFRTQYPVEIKINSTKTKMSPLLKDYI